MLQLLGQSTIFYWRYSNCSFFFVAAGDELSTAGQAADVFVVPTLAIKFRQTDTISFHNDTCDADKTSTVKFSLSDDGQNRNPISFLSFGTVNSE